MARYLVCRLDAIRPDGRMRTSEYFPMEVITDPDGPTMTYEDIVRKAFERIGRHAGSKNQYIGMHDYIVVPLTEATVVSFRKRVDYDVTQAPYQSMEPISESHKKFREEYYG